MRKIFSAIPVLLMLLSIGCQNNSASKELPRIAIAGIAIESSTFSPAVSHEDAFRAKVGDEVFTDYPFMEPDSGITDQAVWLPTLRGHAMPGGIVTREAYESLVTQTLEMLREKLPLDGLFFDIHGAMSVQGLRTKMPSKSNRCRYLDVLSLGRRTAKPRGGDGLWR